MNEQFKVHLLNYQGITKAVQMAEAFDVLLNIIEPMCEDGRCLSIVKTKLEEASFFAKKGMALTTVNQMGSTEAPAVRVTSSFLELPLEIQEEILKKTIDQAREGHRIKLKERV